MAASDPQRQCRTAHVPVPRQSFRQRRRGARCVAGSRAPRRRQGTDPNLSARGCRARACGRARAWASPSWPQGEPDYPARLQEIDDAPPLLAVRGNLAALVRPMVGNRRLAQCVRGRPQVRPADRARPGRSRFRDCFGAGARDRCRAHRASRCERNGGRAGWRARADLSARAWRACASTPRQRGCGFGNAARLGAARAAIFPAATG